MASTVVSDIVIPRVFAPYIRTRTEEKSRIIQSGAVARSPMLDELLAGGGKTFDIPGFNDLAQTAENVASNNPATTSTPDNITTHSQIGVRLSRNMSWGSMDLAQALAGADPLGAIQELVAQRPFRRAA